MNNKSLYLAALMVCLALSASAAPVSADQASRLAANFLNSHAGRRAPAVKPEALNLAYEAKSAAATDFYVFNRDNGGFVIIAGDDTATPVLGFSDNGTFNYNDLPDNARYWLDNYQREMAYLKTHPDAARKQTSALQTEVLPLLTTTWNQSEPFNNLCPTVNTSKAAAGCVAIAVAQIMNYHKWPPQGIGQKTYTFNLNGEEGNSVTLSADFSQSTYEWDKMLDHYGFTNSTAENNNAVARLVYDVGVACEMEYGRSSGATSGYAMRALINHFDYSPGIRFGRRDAVPILEWEKMLRDELDAGRPVYYAGQANGGGHAFVFDGYDTNGYFHVNWGWGGKSDGYFIVTMLNPSEQGIGSYAGGYNSDQEALFGVEKNTGQEINTQPIEGYYSRISFEKQVIPCGTAVKRYFYGFCFTGYGEMPERIRFGTRYYDQNDSIVETTMSSVRGIENSVTYTVSGNVSVPHLPDGTYRLRAVYQLSDTDSIRFFNPPIGRPPYYEIHIKNDTARFVAPITPGNLVLNNLNILNERVYTAATLVVDMSVYNAGEEYFDQLRLNVVRGDTLIMGGNAFMVDIAPGAEYTLRGSVYAPPTLGNYQLVLVDNEGKRVGQPTPFTVEASGRFRLIETTPLAPAYPLLRPDAIEATATYTNTYDHDYSGRIQLLITEPGADPTLASNIIARVYSDSVTIAPGDTVQVRFLGAAEGLEDSHTYSIIAREPKETAIIETIGNKADFVIGTYKAAVVFNEPLTVTPTSLSAAWHHIPNTEQVEILARLPFTPTEQNTLLTESFGHGTRPNTGITASNITSFADNAWPSMKNVFSEIGAIRIGYPGATSGTGYIYSPKLDLRPTAGRLYVTFDAATPEKSRNSELELVDVQSSKATKITVADTTFRHYGVVIDVTSRRAQQVGFRTTNPDGAVIIKNVRFHIADETLNLTSVITETQPVAINNLPENATVELIARPMYIDQTTGGWGSIAIVTLGNQIIPGDLNNDGNINVVDLNLMINLVLQGNHSAEADLNNDGVTNVVDINLIINLILEQQ